MPKRLILPLIAVVATACFTAVLVTRPPASSAPIERRPRGKQVLEPKPSWAVVEPTAHRRPAAAPLRAVSASELPALDEARVRESIRNLRVAVASGNDTVKKVMVSALLKDRAAAERIAREDLARAADAAERDLARKTLEALGRMP